MKTIIKTINRKQTYILVLLSLLSLLFLLFPASPSSLCFTQPLPQQERQVQAREFPYWWTVEFHITVSGEYRYTKKNKGFNGTYSFSASVYGSLSDDTEDYAFMQVIQELKNPEWKEIIIGKSGEERIDLSQKIKPEFSIDYVFQDDKDLSFDFEITPVLAPQPCDLFKSPIKKIILPACSGEKQIRIRDTYNNGIISGSNRVRIPEADICAARETTRNYKWTWEEKKSDSSWQSNHKVNLSLKLTRLEKKKNTGDEG